jgi:PleD family two-component response regulator
VADQKTTLLIVEDDIDVADMLSAYFNVQGYRVLTANWGEDGVRICQANLPDLVILDIRLPDIDGFEVARRMRINRRTQDTPIIFLTERREREDRLKGLALDAEDYITKPFDIQELRLRVKNSLRRTKQGSLTNAVTGLAEGSLVEERLNEWLHERDWALLLVSLDNFDLFREVYGFIAADDLLRATALMLHDAMRDVGGPNDFLGNFSPTEFILVVESSSIEALKDRINRRLGESLDYFYRDQDRKEGKFDDNRLAVRMQQVIEKPVPFESFEKLKGYLVQLVKGG